MCEILLKIFKILLLASLFYQILLISKYRKNRTEVSKKQKLILVSTITMFIISTTLK